MSFPECRDLFCVGILECLELCIPKLRKIVGDAKGVFPINGMALQIYPWFGQAGIGFRVQSDPKTWRIGEWQHRRQQAYARHDRQQQRPDEPGGAHHRRALGSARP